MELEKKIVLVTGVFDVLHHEHITFLKKAKELGTYLVVGVESDKRVQMIKGENRPINPAVKRVANLQQTFLADEIFILPEKFNTPQDHIELIKKINPDYLAVSSHTKHLEEKRKILQMFGGEVVVVHTHNPNVSTTKILERNQ